MNIMAVRICFAGRFEPDSSLNTWPGPLPCFGRIPNFDGSESAASKIRLLR
jgi:hypothetical protein